jgi:hypothetical protein
MADDEVMPTQVLSRRFELNSAQLTTKVWHWTTTQQKQANANMENPTRALSNASLI